MASKFRWFLIVLGCVQWAAAAGWMFCLNGWAGNSVVTERGTPLVWPLDSPPVPYSIDPGPAGAFSPQFMQQLTIKAFRQWGQLRYSELEFAFAGLFDQDITAENVDAKIGNLDDDINPIVFDEDGAILEQLFGQNASQSLLAISRLERDTLGTILEAAIIINGAMIQGESGDINRTYSTLLHEVGHFAGLDHTQILPEFAFDDDPANNIFLPIMLPIETQDFESPTQLSLDDELTLSALYKSDGFLSDLGEILGSVKRPDGRPVQGANVVAMNIDEPFVLRFATVSDGNLTQTGEFTFEGLPPGRYQLFIEPIHTQFMGISGVGPFAENENSLSFIDPVPFEYYNGDKESGSTERDDPMDRVTLEVRAGEVLPPVNFITNEETSPVNQWYIY